MIPVAMDPKRSRIANQTIPRGTKRRAARRQKPLPLTITEADELWFALKEIKLKFGELHLMVSVLEERVMARRIEA